MARCAPDTWTVIRCVSTLEVTEVLERIDRKGVPTEVHAGDNLESELAYGNHRSGARYGEDVLKTVATDVALGRTIVLPAL